MLLKYLLVVTAASHPLSLSIIIQPRPITAASRSASKLTAKILLLH